MFLSLFELGHFHVQVKIVNYEHVCFIDLGMKEANEEKWVLIHVFKPIFISFYQY